MKIYKIRKYGNISYSASLTKEQKEELNSNNKFNHITEIELNEENICSILNEFLHEIEICKSTSNMSCF